MYTDINFILCNGNKGTFNLHIFVYEMKSFRPFCASGKLANLLFYLLVSKSTVWKLEQANTEERNNWPGSVDDAEHTLAVKNRACLYILVIRLGRETLSTDIRSSVSRSCSGSRQLRVEQRE